MHRGLWGWGRLCSLGQAPVNVGLPVLATLPLPVPHPLPPLPAPSGHFAFCRSMFVICPRRSARGPGLIQLACCREGAIPPPRASRSAPAVRERSQRLLLLPR